MDLLIPPPSGSRYFLNEVSKSVYLSGWHTWNNLQDFSSHSVFNWNEYCDNMSALGCNCIRLWSLEPINWNWFPVTTYDTRAGTLSILPFNRSSTPGAVDGGNKFDLSDYNQTYFDRLNERIEYAESKSIYVIVMLFEATTTVITTHFPWSIYNQNNCVAGGVASVGDLFSISSSTTLPYYDGYIKKVVDTVNHHKNVIYEVSNETLSNRLSWQTYVVDRIRAHQSSHSIQHPVGITAFYDVVDNSKYWTISTIDWFSPSRTPGNWGIDAPILSGPGKVYITDTDHLISPGDGGYILPWKQFLRGHNTLHMDPGNFIETWGGGHRVDVHIALGDTVKWSKKIDLTNCIPSTNISSTTYALYKPSWEYLVMQTGSTNFTVNMPAGKYNYEWFLPQASKYLGGGVIVTTSGSNTFMPPQNYYGARILYMKSASVETVTGSNVFRNTTLK